MPQVSEKNPAKNCQFWGLFSSLFSLIFPEKVMVFQPFQPKSRQANKQWFSERKKNQRMGVKMEEKDWYTKQCHHFPPQFKSLPMNLNSSDPKQDDQDGKDYYLYQTVPPLPFPFKSLSMNLYSYDPKQDHIKCFSLTLYYCSQQQISFLSFSKY